MVEKYNQHSEQHSKAVLSRPDHGQEQESSHDFHSLHPVATPTRAQQQRHRRNLRLNGQVDVEKGSLPRHAFTEDRRDSWIDRINSSTKDAIRRTSVIAAVDEKKLIDKVADSINEYGDQHKDDSWTDKVMNFLFPSMGLDSSSTKSDTKAKKQPSDNATDDRKTWSENTKNTIKSNDKGGLNKQPETGMKAIHLEKTYADATQSGHHRSSSLSSTSTSSWSMFNDDENKQKQEESPLDLNNKSQWPPL